MRGSNKNNFGKTRLFPVTEYFISRHTSGNSNFALINITLFEAQPLFK